MPSNVPARPRRPAGVFTQICSILLAGLAAGALWCLLSLSIERGVGALIVPLGFGIGLYFRWLGFSAGRGAVSAAIAILIAFVYAQYLFAAVRIAQMLGFPLRSTLFQMDAVLAWQVTRANLHALDLLWVALAAMVAAASMRYHRVP